MSTICVLGNCGAVGSFKEKGSTFLIESIDA